MPAQVIYDRLTATAVATVPEEAKGGPIIDLIISLIPTLLPLLIGCFKPTPAKVVEIAQNPSLWHIAMLNLHIFREMPDRATFRELGPTVRHAVLTAGKALTETDVVELAA
jgi:hypothetical protein